MAIRFCQINAGRSQIVIDELRLETAKGLHDGILLRNHLMKHRVLTDHAHSNNFKDHITTYVLPYPSSLITSRHRRPYAGYPTLGAGNAPEKVVPRIALFGEQCRLKTIKS